MSYKAQAILAQNDQLMMRIAACAATKGVKSPASWAFDRQWKLSARPGWASTFAQAMANNVANPGNAENIITDAMIKEAVEAILAEEAQPPQ